jgi:hypothetical protein
MVSKQERLLKRGQNMAAGAAVIRDSVISAKFRDRAENIAEVAL